MTKIIHRLRKHPEHIRVRILYVAMLVSAFFLFTAWGFMSSTNVTSESTQTAIKEDLKPFSMLKTSVIDSTKNFSWPSFDKSSKTSTTTENNSATDTVPATDSINTDNTAQNSATDTNNTDSNDTMINSNQ